MQALINLGKTVYDALDRSGEWGALLLVRLLMAYEFGRAGLMKLNGTNWFGPNVAAVVGMLKAVGFRKVKVHSPSLPRPMKRSPSCPRKRLKL